MRTARFLWFNLLLLLALILSGCAPEAAPVTSTLPSPSPMQGTVEPPPLVMNVTVQPTRTPATQPPGLQTGSGAAIQIPARGERLTLPAHILAAVGQPGQQITAALRWQQGLELESDFTLLPHPEGGGLLIGSMDWMMEGPPPNPGTQPATLTLRDQSGISLVEQEVTVVGRDDPDTVLVDLYWLLGEALQPAQRRLPQTRDLPAEALRELLWGPAPNNLAGFETAIPSPQEVLDYPGRQPDWGARVRLLDLQVQDGLAVADFSQEINAYGGGSARVQAIRAQITQTLLQFEGINRVELSVEGQAEGVLQP
jgi:hypothetical protein